MPRSLVIKRTYSIYRHQRERAAQVGQCIPYELDELRTLVKAKLGTPCGYCGAITLTVKNFSLDHRTPVGTGGGWGLDNLTVCCDSCNTIKGNLTAEEFLLFLDFVHREIRKHAVGNLLARIKAGSRIARRG